MFNTVHSVPKSGHSTTLPTIEASIRISMSPQLVLYAQSISDYVVAQLGLLVVNPCGPVEGK